MKKEKQLYLDILKFLNEIANKIDNGYIWREACGLIKEMEEVEKLTTPNINKQRELLRDFNDKLAVHEHYFMPATDEDIDWYIKQ